MAAADIYPRLTDIMRDVFDDDAIVAGPDLLAENVEGWDSLSNLRLVMSIEKAFSIRFSASEIGQLKNVGELANLIAHKAGA